MCELKEYNFLEVQTFLEQGQEALRTLSPGQFAVVTEYPNSRPFPPFNVFQSLLTAAEDKLTNLPPGYTGITVHSM